MLQITIPAFEYFNDETQSFHQVKDTVLRMEHSLISISKWESRWNKPFISSKKNVEETIDYARCMTITQNVDPAVYFALTDEHVKTINEYIDLPMTATTFTDEQNKKFNREIITAEIIYYWMIALQIPSEYRTWHLNQLITLIRVCNIKNSPPKKMSAKERASHNRALNAARRQALNSKG